MYALGVDLGTTFTAAAVWRNGEAEICALGTRAAVIPSVVLARADGSVLTGEAAARRALIEPDRVAREFKRRLGDSTPLLLGGSPFSAVTLTARLLAAVVSAVADREGGPAGSVCVCHPANWGPFKTDLLRQAVRLADVGVPVTFTTEPEAAAVSYARQERLSEGDTVAVYDLGGGTFDAAVLRRTAGGFAILGQPEGIERLGGIDIDAAVFNHVVRAVGAPLAQLEEDDAAAVSAVARLRTECTEAKEALSSDTDVTIPVLLPGTTTEVRLTRAELESMIRPSLYDSIESLKRAVRSAGTEPGELSAVLLVGGSSRMPLVAQLVGAELGRPVAVDAHPKHAVALGAAWLASGTALPVEPEPAPATLAVPTTTPPPERGAAAGPTASEAPTQFVPPVAAPPIVAPPGAIAPVAYPVAPHPSPQGSRSTPPTMPLVTAAPAPVPGGSRPQPPANPAYHTAYRPQTTAPDPLLPRFEGSGPQGGGRGGRWLLLALAFAGLLLGAGGYYYVSHNQQPAPTSLTTPPPQSSTSSPTGASTTSSTSASEANPPPTGQVTSVLITLQGSGQVSGAGSCAQTCTLSLPRGQSALLHADPAYGFSFDRWIGCTHASGPDCTVTPHGTSASLTVVFTSSTPTVTTSTSTSTPPTTSTSITTSTTSSVPGALGPVTLSGATTNTLDVSWTPATGATRYRISWSESPGGRSWTGRPPDYTGTSATLTGLLPSHTYTVTVLPLNDAGLGRGATAVGQTTA